MAEMYGPHELRSSGVTKSRRGKAALTALTAVLGATVSACSSGGDESNPGAVPSAASGSPVVDARVNGPPVPTLQDLTPTGKYRFTRTLISSTYDQKLPRRENRIWTLDLGQCQESSCAGSVKSSSGSRFRYVWNGTNLVIIPPKGGRTAFTGACVDETTGDDVQGSRGRVVETVRWPSLRVTEEGGDGIARQLAGTQRVSTTYEGLTKGCLDLPTDRASYRVVLVRR